MRYTLNDFVHGQWYRLELEGQKEEDCQINYFKALRYDLDRFEGEAIDNTVVFGEWLEIEFEEFFYKSQQIGLEYIVSATPLSVHALVLEVLAYIADLHNKWIEPTGVTNTGKPPMLLRVKPNGWICLDASSFYGEHLKQFGTLARAVKEATYELLESEVLSTTSGKKGVCLEIELHGGQRSKTREKRKSKTYRDLTNDQLVQLHTLAFYRYPNQQPGAAEEYEIFINSGDHGPLALAVKRENATLHFDLSSTGDIYTNTRGSRVYHIWKIMRLLRSWGIEYGKQPPAPATESGSETK